MRLIIRHNETQREKMNKYNPHIHHRRSIRLIGYDYSQAGLYFITICVKNRECLFGEIIDGEMNLNDAGKIANQCWLEIPNHFPDTILHEHIIMPNHVHGIVELVGAKNFSPENADTPCEIVNTPPDISNNINGAKNFSPLRSPSKTIGSVVRGFKIGVTKWMRHNTDIYDVWQRDYYEHIIRNEQSYQTISEYIINNPAKWNDDKFYTT